MIPDESTPEQAPLEARYANCFRVGYTEFEMMIDFSQGGDSTERPAHTRIVVVPVYASQLVRLLEASLGEYQERYGPLPILS